MENVAIGLSLFFALAVSILTGLWVTLLPTLGLLWLIGWLH